MDKEQFALFLKDNRESTAAAIKETVNGKIDALTKELVSHIEHEQDRWQRIEPVVKAHEEAQIVSARDKRIGESAIFWGKVIASIGGIFGAGWLAVKVAAFVALNYKP